MVLTVFLSRDGPYLASSLVSCGRHNNRGRSTLGNLQTQNYIPLTRRGSHEN